MRIYILSLISVFLLEAATGQMGTSMRIEEGVSRELALDRKARISALRYRLRFVLKPGADRIAGSAVTSFDLSDASQPVALDFRDLDERGETIDGDVANLRINDTEISDYSRLGGHLVLPAKYLKAGRNEVAIEFTTGAAAAGRPVIRYPDREDEYFYTLFVPMDASLAFPCFDQPDLKARFTLTIETPADWTAVSNEKEEGSDGELTAGAMHRFAETAPISTYQFAFAAGRFRSFAAGAEAGVPLRWIVRRSQAEKLTEHLPEVSKLTADGMSHLVSYFDHRFPFSKYDQVLLPGFAYGGMEHAGATFLREDAIIFRTTPTKGDKAGRASLILHELAHQWFGDLVTMKWFDDLWLKEGFANFMAYHAMASIYNEPGLSDDRRAAEVWRRFYQRHKPLAYGIDSTPGTTPIYQQVPNLKDAKSAYGAIVYQKAPSLLRALEFLIGEAAFRGGVRIFLREHAYGNAEWADLIAAFERASGKKLGDWAAAWVRQRGMPRVDADCRCGEDGRIAGFELWQKDVLNEGSRWPIRTRVLLFGEDGSSETLTAEFDGPSTKLTEAIGRPCPAFVFLNDGDYGYGRFMLDERSRKAVASRIASIDDAFLRTMLWGGLWDSVREAEMDPAEYLALSIRALQVEEDEELTASLLDRLARVYTRYLTPAQRAAIEGEIERLCFDRMMKSGEAGLRIAWFRAFRSLATSGEARGRLKKLLDGEITIPGVEIRQLDRWRIVAALLATGDAEAETLYAAEAKRDTSDDSAKQAYIAAAAHPDASVKKRYFEGYTGDRSIPEDWVEGSLSNFNSWNQSRLTAEWLGPALEALPRIKRERKIFFALAWLNAFIGGQQAELDAARRAQSVVREFLRQPIDRDLRLKVLEVGDELDRTVRIRNRFGG